MVSALLGGGDVADVCSSVLSKTTSDVTEVLKNQLETSRQIYEMSKAMSMMSAARDEALKTSKQIEEMLLMLPSLSRVGAMSGSLKNVEESAQGNYTPWGRFLSFVDSDSRSVHTKLKFLKWLCTLAPHEKHRDISSRRLQGTGQWLLRLPKFQDWCDVHQPAHSQPSDGDPGRSIWCHGIPGSGKTFIASAPLPCTRRPKD
jgi:hypothetical protein